MTATDVILIANLITIVVLIGTLLLFPFIWYYQWLTAHHLHRIEEMHAGRSDPGADPEPIKFIYDQMAALKASERRWRGEST